MEDFYKCHPDVRSFEVTREDGKHIGYFEQQFQAILFEKSLNENPMIFEEKEIKKLV